MGNCLGCQNSSAPVRIVRRDAVSLSPVYDPVTGRYLGYVSITTTANGSIHERFELEPRALCSTSSSSERSSAYLEPSELVELHETLEDELSTRF
jgi:hypothetical protein